MKCSRGLSAHRTYLLQRGHILLFVAAHSSAVCGSKPLLRQA
jgi:hypothetical protein